MKIHQIVLTKIDPNDRQYDYHYEKFDAQSLRRSIRAHGILTPVVLEQMDAGYRIVHGFRRVDLAQEQQIEQIPGIISDQLPLENLQWSLIDNRVQGELNLYEQSKAIQAAHGLGATASEIIADILPLLGLHSHKNVYDEYRGFIRLPQPLIDFFVSKDTPISRTQVFQNLSEKGLEIAVELLERFSPGINVLDELVTNLHEISRREEQPVPATYAELNVESLLEEAGQPHIALGEIRHKLQEYRYPVLSESNEKIDKLTSQLHLGEHATIHWDKRLENRGINVTYHWERLEDVDQSAQRLVKRENMEVFEEIFGRV